MCQVKTLSVGGRFQLLRNLSPGKKGSFVENIGAVDKEKTFTFRLVERMVRGVVVSGGRKKGGKKKREGLLTRAHICFQLTRAFLVR